MAIYFCLRLFRLNLRNSNLQDTVFKFSFDILLGNCFADIEGSCTLTAVTFTTDINAFIVLFVLVEAFSGGNGQITVFQFGADVLFLKPGRSISIS